MPTTTCEHCHDTHDATYADTAHWPGHGWLPGFGTLCSHCWDYVICQQVMGPEPDFDNDPEGWEAWDDNATNIFANARTQLLLRLENGMQED